MTVIGEVESIPKEHALDIEWRINDFFCLPDRDSNWYDSPEFSFAGSSWRLVIYPYGRSIQNTVGYLDLFLERQSLGPPMHFGYYFSLKTLDGEKDYEVQCGKTVFKQWDFTGLRRFISRSELLKRQSELVPSGVLTVVCTLQNPTPSGRARTQERIWLKYCPCTITAGIAFLAVVRVLKCDDATAECSYSKTNVDDQYISTPITLSEQKYPQRSDIDLQNLNDQKCLPTSAKVHNLFVSHEKLHVAVALVIIVIAIITACVYSYSNATFSHMHLYQEMKKLQTEDLNKAGQDEVSRLYESIDSNSDKTGPTKTNELGDSKKLHPMKIVRKPTELKNSDKPEVAESNEFKASTSRRNPTSITEITESETPPQPVLIVTDVGSTYFKIVWVLPEESKINIAHYSVYFRKFGAKWKLFLPIVSQTSRNLTNLDAGVPYQVYVVAVSPRGIRKSSETVTVRTSYQVFYDDQPKTPGILKVVSTASIIFLSVTACVFAYFKIPLPPANSNREEVKEKLSPEVNDIEDDESDVARSNESEASCYNETAAIASEEKSASFINLTEDYGIVADVNHLLKEKRGIDVTFVLESPSDKTEIFAHQLILAVMSSYFADEFCGKQRGKGHKIIPLKGICPKAFEQMIRYCYGYKPGLTTPEEVCALFNVASQFKVKSLLNLCHTFFRYTKIDPGYVFKVLEISEETEDDSLKDRCDKVLEENTREVLASYELCDITPAIVRIILDLRKLSLSSEYELIKWTFDWAKVKTKEKGSICKNTRDYLESFLQNMNFLSLTIEEFAMVCKDNPNFFTLNEIASISLNIGLPGTREMPEWYGNNLKFRVYTGSKE